MWSVNVKGQEKGNVESGQGGVVQDRNRSRSDLRREHGGFKRKMKLDVHRPIRLLLVSIA